MTAQAAELITSWQRLSRPSRKIEQERVEVIHFRVNGRHRTSRGVIARRRRSRILRRQDLELDDLVGFGR